MPKITLYILFLLLSSLLTAQPRTRPQFLDYQADQWVDSVFKSLSADEKIGQLIMVPAYSKKGIKHRLNLLKMVKENKIGGIITMQGGPMRHVNMVNQLQSVSKTPLLVAIDAEYGLSMRLDSCIKYPYGFTLGAIEKDSLLFTLGSDLGKQCQRLGIHINFAPVSDVNSNPRNPVIGFRSYGDNPERVFHKVTNFGLGLQSQHVLATLKHFPGHGDAQKDSHFALPLIGHTKAQLDSVELYPFRKAIAMGIGGVMTGFLNVPALDSTGTPATLSKSIIQNLLISDLGFEGLVVTDAMNMEGAVDDDTQSDAVGAAVKALIAGNDLLEFVVNPTKVIDAVKRAIESGEISAEDIDRKCRKILMLKRWAGLNKLEPIKTAGLYSDLNQSAYRMTLRNAAQQSLTVLQNQGQLLPLLRLDTLKIASVSIGRSAITPFQHSIDRYTRIENYTISKDADAATITKLLTQLKRYNLVIAQINNLGNFVSSDYRLTETQQEVIKRVTNEMRSVVVLFGNPYILDYLQGVEKAAALVVAYQESAEAEDLAGQLLFGAFGSSGKLPVMVNRHFGSGDGLMTTPLDRFKYTLPEEVGIDSTYLKKKIDSLVYVGINAKAFPGCEVFIAKNGKVVLSQVYGSQTYSGGRLVQEDDLFDFASLTKILAPVPALMKLTQEHLFNVKKKMSDYWPDWKGSNKQDLLVEDVLSHQARLKTGIPFWLRTVDSNGTFKPEYYSKDSTSIFGIRMSKDLFLLNSFPDSVFATIRMSALLKHKHFVYSDLGFILFPKIISLLTHQDYESYLKSNFYSRLGADTLTYKPYLYHSIESMIPTEDDQTFRKGQIQGYVHDESAAVLGGVSGNAGLFGTINDAAKMMQMYLNYGTYGGDRYLSDAILKDWTRRHFENLHNRRGYGFDKPQVGNNLSSGDRSYPAPLCNDASFGHTGFTGTYAWADPVTGILFLFFSNRIYPSRDNHLLNKLNLREALQQMTYQILLHPKSLN
jgi:beta-N-acetylhexosaminidase